MTYETSFRKHVFKIKEKEKLTYEQTSKQFGINIRTLFRWKHKPIDTKRRNKPATKIHMEALKKIWIIALMPTIMSAPLDLKQVHTPDGQL